MKHDSLCIKDSNHVLFASLLFVFLSLPPPHRLQAYYLKRISKGYIFRAHPKPWEACLEKPGGGLEIMQKWKDKPLLRDAAKVRV